MLRIPAKRFGFTRHPDTSESDLVERQEWRIMQSQLNLRDLLP